MKLTSFGEIMLRLQPNNSNRIIQSTNFDVQYGGAESNVAVSLSLLGDQTSYVTKLPDNLLGNAALYRLRGLGVDTTQIVRGGNRLGIYFFESGASVRNTNVIYDRKNSAFSTSLITDYDWSIILKDTDYFYVSGITPAISTELQHIVLEAVAYCQKKGIIVIYDANYRGKMWSTQEAQSFSRKIMPFVSICFAHDEDFESSFGIPAFNGDMTNGISQKEQFETAITQLTKQYPNVQIFGSVLRNIYSVESSEWMALLFENNTFFESSKYKIHVLEGVAAGDAFSAGLMHGLIHHYAPQQQLDFAIANSVNKLTVHGDFNLASEKEIMSLIHSNSSTMNR
ncbi:sugar kinase [Levilactobacillus sp. HBUAS70063]|uniref:sugar kinase n=1 Tax=Levilactobacillus sp. HBUAS70063 TaxID=3109359 RepID=UPI0031333C3D